MKTISIQSIGSANYKTGNVKFESDKWAKAFGPGGNVPAGNYTVCVSVLDKTTDEEIGKGCIEQKITGSDIPNDIAPADGHAFSEADIKKPIIFRWTPLVPKPRGPVTYRLMVWQLMQGQTGEKAIEVNQPLITKDVDNLTQTSIDNLITVPCLPPYSCDFVWNVQAFNKEGKLIGESLPSPKGWFGFRIEGHIGTNLNTLNACKDFSVQLMDYRKGNTVDPGGVELGITNKYRGDDPKNKPKSFSLQIADAAETDLAESVIKGWTRTTSKFPPGSSSIKWTHRSGDIPKGETKFGRIGFANANTGPISVQYEWLNKDDQVICSGTIDLPGNSGSGSTGGGPGSQETKIKLESPVDGWSGDGRKLLGFAWSYWEPDETFSIRIVEKKDDQSPDDAMQKNEAFFERNGIEGTTFHYPESAPKFEAGKKYAWLVQYGNLRSGINLFECLPTSDAVVGVKINPLAPNQLRLEDLNFQLTNLSKGPLDVSVRGTVTDVGLGTILNDDSSIPFSLPPGSSTFIVGDINNENDETFSRWRKLPAGNYTVCVSVLDKWGKEIGKGCIDQKINGAYVPDTLPLPPKFAFRWKTDYRIERPDVLEYLKTEELVIPQGDYPFDYSSNPNGNVTLRLLKPIPDKGIDKKGIMSNADCMDPSCLEDGESCYRAFGGIMNCLVTPIIRDGMIIELILSYKGGNSGSRSTGGKTENENELSSLFSRRTTPLGAGQAPIKLIKPTGDLPPTSNSPTFEWKTENPAEGVSYSIVVRETPERGEPENGVMVLERSNIRETTLPYPKNSPPLDPAKSYAWQVSWFKNGRLMGRTSFTHFRFSIETLFYYDLAKEPSNTYTEISNGVLRVQFFNRYASVENIKLSIYDVEAQKIKRKSKDVIKLNCVTGLNRISIDIQDYNLEPGRLYLLTISDSHTNYHFNFKVTNDREK